MMKITIEKNINASIADVWRSFNEPDDIVQWDGTDRWQIVRASNDLEVGGRLVLRIKPKDGGEEFDLAATYSRIEPRQLLEFQMEGDRMARMEFIETDSTPASPYGKPSMPTRRGLKARNAQNGKAFLTASPNTSNGNAARLNNRSPTSRCT